MWWKGMEKNHHFIERNSSRIKINKNKEEAHRNNLVEEVVITKLDKVDPSHITPFGKNKENEFE